MSDTPPPERPRVRVSAGSSNDRLGALTTDQVSTMVGKLTSDSLQNFAARYGLGTGNLLSSSTYGFNPMTRLQQLLEWAYRGSWVVGVGCDVVAEDMTRMGVEMNSETSPDDLERLLTAERELMLWQTLADTIRWSRLYGGALMVMMIDGQDFAAELDTDTIAPEQLRGFMVLDRWMVQPTFSDLILDYGPDYGLPRFYDVVQNAPFMPRQRIHSSRVLRMDGVTLPFRQRLAENGWGMSIIERLYDRLIAFDSGTLGVSQLLFRAYVRVYKVDGYRAIMAADGTQLIEKFMRAVDMMRMLQSNEGLSVIDAKDEMEAMTYSFAGMPEALELLAQQIAGALQIPMVRLMGQSPRGMNATGDSDFRQYDYLIRAAQESRLRRPLTTIYKVLYQSTLGKPPPPNWNFQFRSINPLSEMEKAEIAERDTGTIASAHGAGIIDTATALKELKQSSILTGRWTNIDDDMIADAEENAPAPWDAEAQQGMPGMTGGGPPGMMGGKGPPGTALKLPTSAPGGQKPSGGFDHAPQWYRRERQARG
jgi:uncharacterized protein